MIPEELPSRVHHGHPMRNDGPVRPLLHAGTIYWRHLDRGLMGGMLRLVVGRTLHQDKKEEAHDHGKQPGTEGATDLFPVQASTELVHNSPFPSIMLDCRTGMVGTFIIYRFFFKM
ncbi:hypothetical protein MK805_10610 [Shimazuella sp. AN120528]|uniref:hypothetical protein n=1 Tax=Shimazuella soli TaxID=1892854 RepID=UPI001F0ED53E|nr:hypothetical protein [Shimazuella soli]MCH5585402.1 hypothetical protein [Shimazuella soli]